MVQSFIYERKWGALLPTDSLAPDEPRYLTGLAARSHARTVTVLLFEHWYFAWMSAAFQARLTYRCQIDVQRPLRQFYRTKAWWSGHFQFLGESTTIHVRNDETGRELIANEMFTFAGPVGVMTRKKTPQNLKRAASLVASLTRLLPDAEACFPPLFETWRLVRHNEAKKQSTRARRQKLRRM